MLSISDLQPLINAISYQNNSNTPNTSNRVATLTSLTDSGSNLGSNDNINDFLSVESTVTMVTVNDDPSISGLPTDITFTEDVAGNVDFSAASLSDVDAKSGTIQLVISASSGVLSASSGASVTIVGSGTGTLNLTGTVSDIDSYLNTPSNIKYTGDSNVNGIAAASLSLTANDNGNTGTGGGADVTLGTVNIDIIAVNDDPTASGFTAFPIYQGTAYYFTSTDFSYFDVDNDPIDHIRVTLSPTSGTLWLDSNSNGILDLVEDILTTGESITKADLDAGYLKYINNTGASSSFIFEVNDGTVYSTTYSVTLEVIPVPTVTLSLDPVTSISEDAGATNIKATLSNVFNKTITVNLTNSGTAISGGTDYNISENFIIVNVGKMFGIVALTSVNDALYEGDEIIKTVISSVINALEDGEQEVTCTITDDDAIPTVSFSLAEKSNLNESKDITINVDLSQISGKDVSIPFIISELSTATGGGVDYSINASPLIILAGANSAQIKLTIVDDFFNEADETVIIDMGIPTNATASGTISHTATILDDDVVGFRTNQSDGTTIVLESGTNDIFSVELKSQPSSDVVLNIISADEGEAIVDKSSISFTPTSWDSPQYISVTGVDDDLSDGDKITNITISVDAKKSDDAFDALKDQIVNVSTIDDDIPGFTLSKLNASVSESGSTDSFTVVLDTKPASDVVFNIVNANTSEVTVDKASLTFTPDNWAIAQSIVLSSVGDGVVDGNQSILIIISVDDLNSADAFDALADQTVSCTTIDDEIADLIIKESVGFTHVNERGTSDAFSIRLTGKPVSDVVLSVSSSDTGEVSVDKATFTFTTDNWNTPQEVTVTGVDDVLSDGEQIVTITISVVDGSSHDAFDSVLDKEVSVTNADNDTAGFTVSRTNGSAHVSENEYITLDTMWVVLNSRPSSNVVLSFVSSNEDEVLVDKYKYYFSAGDWDIPQRFLIGGMNDNFVDGDITTPLTIGVVDAESPDDYDLLPDQIINVINADNDVAAFTLSKTTAMLAEFGTETFTLHLKSRPLSDVVFNISAGDSDEISVSPSSLTFTAADGWQTKKTVTVTGLDDFRIDGSQSSTITVSIDPDKSNDFFDALADKTVTVITTDDDVAAFVIVESDGNSIVDEAGASDSFTVILKSQPDSDVVIHLANSDAGELGVSPASLIFTSVNWNVPQIVNLTGEDDLFDDGDQSTTVTLSVDAANSDNNFDFMSSQIVNVITADDDSSPVITASQTLSVNEDALNNASLGTVSVSDADAGTTYSNWTIISGNADGVFAINSISGVITVVDNSKLDFETIQTYSLGISVSDGINTSLVESVIINVNDINDELPVVTASQSFSVNEDAINEASLGTVSAEDSDAGTTYSNWTISSGNSDGVFAIDAMSGVITVADNSGLDFEMSSTYILGISVSDGFNASAVENVNITINNVNESPTAIHLSNTTLAENLAVGSQVGILTASDVDASESFTYTISENDNFKLAGNQLVSKVEFDYETKESYTFEVTVTDQGDLSFTQSFTIQIIDVNEALLFTSEPIIVGVEAVEYSYTIKCMDLDKDAISLVAIEKPECLSLLDNGDGTWTLSGTPVLGGLYHVLLEASDSEFTVQQEFDIEVEVVTGIEPDLTTSKLSIYPNPVANELHIDFSELKGEDLSIALYSLTGNLIFKEVYQSIAGEIRIRKSVRNLHTGIYLLMIDSEDYHKTYKLVKI